MATTTRDGITARKGTCYEPQRFAAAVPVHFHPLGGTRFLGLFDGYWGDATPSTALAGHYTAKTVVDKPAAVVIDAATGQVSVPPGLLDFSLPGTVEGQRLLAAASSSTFVLTLTEVSGQVFLHHWNIDRDGYLGSLGVYAFHDIVTADAQQARLDRGVYFDGIFVYLWGSGLTDNRIYTARQYVSKLGDPWFYQTDEGWSPNGATAVGGGVTTLGPMSTMVVRGTSLVTTVAVDGPNQVGVIWATRTMTDPWTKLFQATIDTTTAWTGNGLMLQPQVRVNPAAMPPEAATAIPWVRTARASDALTVSWGLFPVPPSLA